MYSSTITQAQVDKLEASTNLKLYRHTPADSRAVSDHLKSAMGDDGKLTRQLRPEEHAFIRNERILCQLDATYALRYMCNPPEAPIWMADGSFKPIGDIHVGDLVIGWSSAGDGKTARGKQAVRKRAMVTSSVVGVAKRLSPIVAVHMESGRTIRCTQDHLWSSYWTKGRKDRDYRTGEVWVRPEVGRILRFFVQPVDVEPDSRVGGWLGGIYDGEGSGNVISQSLAHNPEVCAEIEHALNLAGIPFAVYQYDKSGKAAAYSMLGGR